MQRSTAVERKVVRHGAPIPEMLGGAIIGGLVSVVLTYVPDVAPLVDAKSWTLWLIIAVAALIGAAVSFVLAREHVVEVKERSEPLSYRRAA